MTRLLATPRPDGLLVPVATAGDDGLLRPAGEGCADRCCGECWRVANPCPPAPDLPPECTPEPPEEIYVNCAVVCSTTGQPVTPGQTFKRGQFCYTVGDRIAFEEIPDGATILEAGAEVECVGGCEDIRCPTQVLWIVGRPCVEAPGPYPAIPACLIDHCTVRAIGGVCYTFDPADAQELDPALPVYELGPEFLDCCDCLTDQQPLGPCSGATAPADVCNPEAGQTGPCCCDDADAYEVLSFHSQASDRVVQVGPFGNRTEDDIDWEITLGGLVPGGNGDRYGTRTQWGEQRQYDPGQSQPHTVIPFFDQRTVIISPIRCPHLGLSVSFEGGGLEGFGFIFPGLADPYIICTGSLDISGGSESYTGNFHRTCTLATFTGSATRTINFPPAGPGDGSFDRTSTASASWSVRRLPVEGPCTNGCGDGSSAVKGGVLASRVGARTTRDLGSGLGGFL